MKNKDFGRAHLDDQIVLDDTVFGVRGMTTWAGADPALDQFSGFSIGANRHGLLCCDSNVVTLDGLENYDVMTEVALRQGHDVSSAVEAVVSACGQRETSWGNLVLIDAERAVSLEIRGRAVYAYVLTSKGNEVVLHVKQGQPCRSDGYHAISVPFGDRFSESATTAFLNRYPTANKTNFATPARHSADISPSASGSASAT